MTTSSAGEREEERKTGPTGDGHGRVLYHQPPSRQSRGGILAMFWAFGLGLILVSQNARTAQPRIGMRNGSRGTNVRRRKPVDAAAMSES